MSGMTRAGVLKELREINRVMRYVTSRWTHAPSTIYFADGPGQPSRYHWGNEQRARHDIPSGEWQHNNVAELNELRQRMAEIIHQAQYLTDWADKRIKELEKVRS